jgi:ribonuclease HI
VKKNILIFTDGSSRGNPGPGGWGAIVVVPEGEAFRVKELGGREAPTTNNHMELMAAREALTFVEKKADKTTEVTIFIDSAYLINGITGWVFAWEKNNWMTKTKEPVLNKDLWTDLLALVFRMNKKSSLVWEKVEGHAGYYGNERADIIATSYADSEQVLLFSGELSAYEKLIGGKLTDKDEAVVKKKKTSSSKKAFSYVSYVDGTAYVDASWDACEKRVKGMKGVKYKKVFSKEEEESLIEAWSRS